MSTTDVIDVVWRAMTDSEFYSPNDLTNTSGHSVDAISRVLEFLTRYGFTDRITRHEPIYRKSANAPDPGSTLRILQTLLLQNAAKAPRREP